MAKQTKKTGASIQELRATFKGLQIAQKKAFINNLREQLKGMNSGKYNEFLSECIKDYNMQVKAARPSTTANAATENANKAVKDDISSEIFARAIASMLKEPSDSTPVSMSKRLAGTWEREENGKVYYYTFKDDGTIETNDIPGNEILTGHFVFDQDNVLHMEPHEVLKISNLVSTGGHLMISFEDGSSRDYRKKRD